MREYLKRRIVNTKESRGWPNLCGKCGANADPIFEVKEVFKIEISRSKLEMRVTHLGDTEDCDHDWKPFPHYAF